MSSHARKIDGSSVSCVGIGPRNRRACARRVRDKELYRKILGIEEPWTV